jgi:hypothetical protein
MAVGIPNAAMVAADTVGFAGEEHIPKGGMFTMETWSMILATGKLSMYLSLTGSTINKLGAEPYEQII